MNHFVANSIFNNKIFVVVTNTINSVYPLQYTIILCYV